MRDARYAQWLSIADELEALHDLAYGEAGPLSHVKGVETYASSGPAVADWIRQKCDSGHWYWWDKSTIAGRAMWPLRSFDRLISEAGGRFESNEKGKELIKRIEPLKGRISRALSA